MLSYTFLLIAAMGLRFVSATPPACLLAAVNTQPNPADLQALCGPGASQVEKAILSGCGKQTSAAADAFAAVCKAAGTTIDESFTSSAASATSTSGVTNVTSSMMVLATYSDSSCSCMKTTSYMTASTGFASATGSAATAANTSIPGTKTGASGTSSKTASGSVAVSTSGAMQNTVQYAATIIVLGAACLLAI